MEILISNWSNVQSMPQTFVFPPDRRPKNHNDTICKDIPVIDLEKTHDVQTRPHIIQQILKASKEYGLFQVRTFNSLHGRLCINFQKLVVTTLNFGAT